MGKYRSSVVGKKRQQEQELQCMSARPPQECWSVRERTNFKIALGRFGQDWQKVAQFVGTKTTNQTCGYAEEYLLKSQTDGLPKSVPSPTVLGSCRKHSSDYRQQKSFSDTDLSGEDKDQPLPMFIDSSAAGGQRSQQTTLHISAAANADVVSPVVHL